MPKFHCLTAIVTGLGLLAGAAPAVAKTGKGNAMITAALSGQPSAVIADDYRPAGYHIVVSQEVLVDGERAELSRYERLDGRNAGLGGEHFSTVIDEKGRLKGFARMDPDLAVGVLPSPEEARATAMLFLKAAAPDLLGTLQISWIAPHDEPLRVRHGDRSERLTLTGMKVKMRNTADGRWFWVIVGTDRKVMVFERDIVWVTFPGHRQTEQWLHDSWLAETGRLARSF